ncbi:MAG: response regulator [Myxococcales bacterium FL481]|nr:MAG: response regulator [Myxococcales bacterium FL481]
MDDKERDVTQRVLVVEDEAVLRSAIVRSLAKLSGVEADGAGTVADALALIASAPPSLLVTDLDLPDGSGLEILGSLDRAKIEIPVIVISAYLGTLGSQIPARANVTVYEKPVAMTELRAAVGAKLARDETEEAMPFSLDEYVQLACIGRHSVVIEVRGLGAEGRIIVWQGDVHCAQDDEGGGDTAFVRLARLALAGDTTVACRGVTACEEPRNISPGAWQSLLMDSARAHDEDHRDETGACSKVVAPAQPSAMSVAADETTEDVFAQMFDDDDADAARTLGPTGTVPAAANGPTPGEGDGPAPGGPTRRSDSPIREVVSESTHAAFADACERGIEALLAKDYPRALSQFLAAEQLCPGDPLVRGNIERLTDLGFLREAG